MSIIWWVLSCIILPTLSAVLTASISGDSAALTESIVVEVVVVSLLLLQAVMVVTIITRANIAACFRSR